MIGISRISKNVNDYAIEWGRKICLEPIENAKGMNTNYGDIFNEIVQESNLIQGTRSSIDPSYFKYQPHDIFVHNHPEGTPLNINDLDAAVRMNMKKIFAFTKDGFTSIDLTAAENSPRVSRNTMGLWTMEAINYQNCFVQDLQKRAWDENITREDGQQIISKFLLEKINDFCKWSGAIFENLKWSDLK